MKLLKFYLNIKMITKKYIYLLLVVLSTQFVYAQKDKASLLASVSYKLNQTKNEKLIIDDICILDIGKNQNYFYSKNLAENLKKMDETFERAKTTGVKPNFDSKDFVFRTYRYYYLINSDKKQAIKIQSVSSQMLGSVEFSDLQNEWKIMTDTLTINGFKCQKAILEQDTKTVVAWFCEDIPFQTGPLGYFGLPGLIVKATTSDGFEAELNGIVYNKDIKKQLNIRDYTFVSATDLKKAIENAKANRSGGGSSPSGAKKQTIGN